MQFRPLSFLFISILFLLSCAQKTSDSIISSPSQEADQISESSVTPEVGTLSASKHKIPIDKRLRTGILPNGINYFIQPNSKPEKRAELRLVINAGSILEDEDQRGLAHFVEHMAFNGTENFEKSELVDYLESIGMRFGPDLNAYTSFDETVYMLQVRTDSIALFDKGMLVLRDWATGITFDHEEIDKERGVVESEWRSRLSPDQRMQQKFLPVLYKGSRYAERLPIGDPEIINHADYETIKRFYKDWYRPDLMAIVVVGDIDPDKAEQEIKKLFSDIPAKKGRERKTYDVPHHPETLVSIVSDKEASFTNVRIVYKHDKIHVRDQKDYRSSLVRNLYNSMLNSRLDELSKQPEPPFIFAATGYGGDIGALDTYSSFAFVAEGKAEQALESLMTENKRVLLHGFTPGELERARKNMMEQAERSMKEMDKTESNRLAMRYVYRFLDNIPIPDPEQMLDMYQKYLPQIQLSEVNQLAQQWIRDESRVVVITGPEKADFPLPDEGKVLEIVSAIDASNPDPYEDEVVDQPFFTETLDQAKVVNEELFEEVGVTYLELENGVEVYLKKTDFKNDQVLLSASSPGGTSLYNDSEYFSASQAASIVSEAGIGAFSPVQLEKLLAGKTASVRPYISGSYEGFNGGAAPDDVEVMFQMIYKYVTDPRIDEQAFNSFITKQRGIYQNLMSNPQYFFQDYVNKKIYDNHPRVGFPEDSDWTSLNYKRVMEIYNERFSDASDFTFIIVGNFDEALMRDYVRTYLGNLPANNREEEWKDVGVRPVSDPLIERIERGEAPKTNVHMMFHGPFEYSRDNNYLMQSTIDYLRIKLREELREDLGGVYGVGIYGGGNKVPYENYRITISFNADPPKTDTLIEAAKGVIERAMTDGPDAEDMKKVTEMQRQSRIKQLKENRYWQSKIRQAHNEEQQFDNILLDALEKRISSLTAAQIKSAVGQYFNYDRYVEIIMDPEEKEAN